MPESGGEEECGRIEVITGVMFAGKTTELLRRIKESRQPSVIFSMDTRFGAGQIGTHASNKGIMPCLHATHSRGVDDYLEEHHDEFQVLGVDEAQFFDESLVSVCRKWADRGKRVIVSGLLQDYLSNPFLTVVLMMAEAESVDIVNRLCSRCRTSTAIRNHRTVSSPDRVLQGAGEAYVPLCRHCYRKEHSS